MHIVGVLCKLDLAIGIMQGSVRKVFPLPALLDFNLKFKPPTVVLNDEINAIGVRVDIGNVAEALCEKAENIVLGVVVSVVKRPTKWLTH